MSLSTILNSKTQILSLLICICVCFFSFSSNAQLKIGDPAPEIRLPDSLGKWTLLSEVKAEIVLLDFWAAWCPPCIVAVQELKRIKEKYPAASFEIFALSLDRDYWGWVNMVRKIGLPFIHVNDAYGLKSPRCKAYGVSSIPQKFLIKEGKIVAINPTFEEVETAIRQ